jgi:hypothetical protein
MTNNIVFVWVSLSADIQDISSLQIWKCVLRIKDRFQNYSFIRVHAPTEDKSDMENDHFYEQLQRTYIQCPSWF